MQHIPDPLKSILSTATSSEPKPRPLPFLYRIMKANGGLFARIMGPSYYRWCVDQRYLEREDYRYDKLIFHLHKAKKADLNALIGLLIEEDYQEEYYSIKSHVAKQQRLKKTLMVTKAIRAYSYSPEKLLHLRTDYLIYVAPDQTTNDLVFSYEKDLGDDDNQGIHSRIKTVSFSGLAGAWYSNPFDYTELDHLRTWIDRVKRAQRRVFLAKENDLQEDTDFLEYDNVSFDDYGNKKIHHVKVRLLNFKKQLGVLEGERKDALEAARKAKKAKQRKEKNNGKKA